jgi:hypothetical protein
MDANFASTNCSSISCWLIQQNNFTNSSRKGLLYVQVVYKYIVEIYKWNSQVQLQFAIVVVFL